MRILIAEDDPVSRYVLEAMLKNWGYDLVVTGNGLEAWEALQANDAPQLAVLDWMMPGLDGVEVCRRSRQMTATKSVYIILLTAKAEKNNIVEGLEAGANDYVIKPFAREELRARVGVGERVIHLQNDLAARVTELQDALSQVKQLQGILPICSHCKKVRDDKNYWQQVESYISAHSEAQFSHSICPDCFERVVKPEIENWERKLNKQ
ncbi:MAG TPA: response regulator transcription factor [Blastocatellia bacterium]|jgi:DNA-binding response OmpR family regulator|nr:response regulator transcription factor [Blastocatellia bacterium]